jgi:hypothetical protein
MVAQNELRLLPFLLKLDLSHVSDRRLLRVQFQGTFAYNISVYRTPDLRRAKALRAFRMRPSASACVA